MISITTCVPTYNGAAHIGAQLASILASPAVTEVLVSDDGSTDGTLQAVQSIDDARLRLLEGPRAGLVANYEFLLSRARGDVIFLADQDDVWLPDKVDIMMRYLEHADLVVCDCTVTDAELNTIHASFFALRGSGPGLLRNLARNSYLGCCMALRRDVLRHALPFPKRTPMHDWWLGLVAESWGRVAFVRQPLVMYRRHGANASSTAEPSRASWSTRLRWRVSLACALAARRWAQLRTDAAAEGAP